jgi:hypothetical protein
LLVGRVERYRDLRRMTGRLRGAAKQVEGKPMRNEEQRHDGDVSSAIIAIVNDSVPVSDGHDVNAVGSERGGLRAHRS